MNNPIKRMFVLISKGISFLDLDGTYTSYLLDGYDVLGKSSLFFFVDQSIVYGVSLMWIWRILQRTSESSLETSGLLERVEVFDVNGNSILISDLWKDRKAVVAFARHFGCVLCRKRADMLAAKKDRMDASGVALVLIGPGSVDQARVFSEQTNFKGEVYADPSYASYKALSFVSGVTTTFTPGSALKIIEAYMEGYRQDWELSFEKDTRTRGGWQQGGIIVAGPGISNISYIHKDKEAGDDPEVEEIMKVCCP
ncbi:thioredoxin-like protein AAED1, chloroplastic [Tanacetum coccineum]